jgi:hypothetical protein
MCAFKICTLLLALNIQKAITLRVRSNICPRLDRCLRLRKRLCVCSPLGSRSIHFDILLHCLFRTSYLYESVRQFTCLVDLNRLMNVCSVLLDDESAFSNVV